MRAIFTHLLITASCCLCAGTISAQAPLALQATADSLFQNSKFPAAIAQYKSAQQAFAVQKNWINYLQCQAGIGKSLVYSFQYKPAEDTLRRGLVLYNDKLGRTEAAESKEIWLLLKLNLSDALRSGGKADESTTILQEILPVAKGFYPAGNAYMGRLYMALAYASFDQRSYLETEHYAELSLEVFGREGEFDRPMAIYSYHIMGKAKEKLYDFQGALVCFEKIDAWKGYQKNNKRARLTDGLFYADLGRLYLSIGDYTRGLEYCQLSLSVYQGIMGLKSEPAIQQMMAVGDAYRLRRDCSSALAEYRRALIYIDSFSKQPSENRALTLSHIADCQAGQGQWTTAVQSWQSAIIEAQRLNSPRCLPIIQESLGRFYLRNNNPTEATTYLEEARNSLQAQSQSHIGDICRVKSLLGRALILQERYDESLEQVQEALQLQCQRAVTLSNFDNPQEGKIVLSQDLILTLSVKADALYYKWEAQGASPQLLTKALQTCQFAIRAGERLRHNFQRDYEENDEWVRQYRSLFTRGVSVAYQLYLQTQDVAYLQQAFSMSDRSKALLLSENLENEAAKISAGIPRTILDQENTLKREIAFYERKMADVGAGQDNGVGQFAGLLHDKKYELDALIAQMEQDYPDYFEHKYRPRLISARDIQAELGENGLFVEYLNDPSQRRIYIFTIDRQNGLQLAIQTLPEGISRQFSTFSALLESVYLAQEEKRRQFIQLSHQLYRTYLLPVAGALKDKTELTIVGDGALSLMPFELLLPESIDLPYTELPYLLRQAQISYHYSGSLFVRQRMQRNAQPYEGLLVFAPTFPDNGGGVTAPVRSSSLQANFSPLPHAQEEANSISKLFGNGSVTQLMKGSATKVALRAALEQPHRIVHVASHSFINEKTPGLSGIACAPSDQQAKGEILYANELNSLQIRADLVILSSCDSGWGRLSDQEGLLGLSRSFVNAGASSIVHSLWAANDRATSRFMVWFYEEIAAGKTYAAALRAAKLKMLGDPAIATPIFWGGFLLIGQ